MNKQEQGQAVAQKTATHTPGPWRVDGGESKNGDLFIWQDGNYMGGHAIARIFFAAPGDTQSNARLIAAAPDLLRACNLMAYWLELYPIKAMPPSQLVFTKAAIAKAMGE